MKHKILTILLAIGLLLSLTGCAEQVQLAGLQVNGSVPVLAVGSTAPVALRYSFSKEAPSEEEIAAVLEQVSLVWSSSDETVATVDAKGTVTAVAPGSATITVSTTMPGSTSGQGVYNATVDVTVLVPLEGAIAPEEKTLDLLAGETTKLDVQVQPASATGVEITYASSNEAVATVDASGKVTPVADGEATITTTVAGEDLDGPVTKTLTTKVTVALLPQGIGLENTEGLLYVGYSYQLEPHTLPEEAPASTYTYESSDEAVATVDETGSIKAIAPGTATITVTSEEGHTIDYALTVTAAPRQGSGSAGGSSGGGTSGGTGTGGDSGAGGGAPTAPTPADGGGTPATPPPADNGGTPAPPPAPPVDGGGGTPPAPSGPTGDGTPENPYGQNDFVDVSEADRQDGDGLA